jgi:hypothetical protein
VEVEVDPWMWWVGERRRGRWREWEERGAGRVGCVKEARWMDGTGRLGWDSSVRK